VIRMRVGIELIRDSGQVRPNLLYLPLLMALPMPDP
jgi:hypothetical protein